MTKLNFQAELYQNNKKVINENDKATANKYGTMTQKAIEEILNHNDIS